jgi:pSer/pThr/pTyr-binding forkhead associated (FHA) protein
VRETSNPKLGKCPKCGKSTPIRSGSCLYCGALLDGVRAEVQATGAKIMEEPRQRGAGGGQRFQKVYDARGHYLFLGAREPLLLEPNKLFLIGRDPHASLVIHSAEVSRQHCEIDWRGDPPRPTLVEVRARNGTYVNDKPLKKGEPESLRDRDVIRLGRDFELVYRQLDERELKETLTDTGRADTRAIRLSAPQAAPAPMPMPVAAMAPSLMPPGMVPQVPAQTAAILPNTGDLAHIPGALLLEHLHRDRRSGVLTIFDGQTMGEIQLSEGRARAAVFGTLTSRDALEAIGRSVRGVYRFAPEAPQAPLPVLQAAPAIPPDLLALYQAQLQSGGRSAPIEPAVSRPVPPELAGLFASLLQATQAPAPPPPPPLLQPPPVLQGPIAMPTTLPLRAGKSTGPVPPLTGSAPPFKPASEPVLSEAAASFGNSPAGFGSSPGGFGSSPSGFGSPALRPPSDTGPLRPPSDVGRPPSDVGPLRPGPARSPSTSGRQPPLRADGVRASDKPPTTVAGYAAPGGPAVGDTPEAKEASALLATMRALGLAGESLGNFVGDTVGKLLDEGKLPIALELGERGLDLADKGNFEGALATRMAFKNKLSKNPQKIARFLELLEKIAPQRGQDWASQAAARALRLIDPEVPPGPDDGSVLGKIAALARR